MLSDEQRAAIERRSGSLALAANAGSGKTSVLVERYVRAVCEDGVRPGGSLRSHSPIAPRGSCARRVRQALLDAGEREAARESGRQHRSRPSMALRAAAARPRRCLPGVPPEFVVLDDAEAAGLREQRLPAGARRLASTTAGARAGCHLRRRRAAARAARGLSTSSQPRRAMRPALPRRSRATTRRAPPRRSAWRAPVQRSSCARAGSGARHRAGCTGPPRALRRGPALGRRKPACRRRAGADAPRQRFERCAGPAAKPTTLHATPSRRPRG